jgi:hypothetical protein
MILDQDLHKFDLEKDQSGAEIVKLVSKILKSGGTS